MGSAVSSESESFSLHHARNSSDIAFAQKHDAKNVNVVNGKEEEEMVVRIEFMNKKHQLSGVSPISSSRASPLPSLATASDHGSDTSSDRDDTMVDDRNRIKKPVNEKLFKSPSLASNASSISLTSSQSASCFSPISNEIDKLSPFAESECIAFDACDEEKRVGLESFIPLKLLGKGSYGEVFLAISKDTHEPVAIKALSIEEVIRSEQVDNTLTEICVHKTLAKRKYPCPFITPMRYAFHNDTHLFLVFDFMQGGELYRHLCLRGSLPENLAKFYAAEICLAIGYLHAIGVVYRDLKPENLCLDSKGHINLVDLGLCKDGVTSCSSGLNGLCGTTEYLAPEILKFSGYGLSADWWSFGMVLYEMLTGLPPWYSNDQSYVINGILNCDITFPDCDISPEAKDIIIRLLDKDPRRRLGGKGGTREVMSHPFFKNIDWVKLAKRGVDSPFVPPHGGADMVRNFDEGFTKSKISSLSSNPTSASFLFSEEYQKLVKASKFDYTLYQNQSEKLFQEDACDITPLSTEAY